MKYSSEAWWFFFILYWIFAVGSAFLLPSWGWLIVWIACFFTTIFVPMVLEKREKYEGVWEDD